MFESNLRPRRRFQRRHKLYQSKRRKPTTAMLRPAVHHILVVPRGEMRGKSVPMSKNCLWISRLGLRSLGTFPHLLATEANKCVAKTKNPPSRAGSWQPLSGQFGGVRELLLSRCWGLIRVVGLLLTH